MYRVYKRLGETFLQSMLIGEFSTFEEARKNGIEKVCDDVDNEGGDENYWFSDSTEPNEAYKVHIKKLQ